MPARCRAAALGCVMRENFGTGIRAWRAAFLHSRRNVRGRHPQRSSDESPHSISGFCAIGDRNVVGQSAEQVWFTQRELASGLLRALAPTYESKVIDPDIYWFVTAFDYDVDAADGRGV